MAIRIILADDDRLITESMKIIIGMDERFHIVGIAGNGREALALCQKETVDVALLDIRMPHMNGVDATEAIVRTTDTKVLILTTFDEDEMIKKAFEYGASGYILKNNPPDQVKNAILTIAGGNAVVQDVVLNRLQSSTSRDDRLEGLTPREREIVVAISDGLTNKEIGQKLFISEGTVKNNVTSILGKLHLEHRTQIAIYYLKD